MKANIVIEMASDGTFSCYMHEELPDFALFGYGNSANEAKEDMLNAYQEIKEMLEMEGKVTPNLEFIYHYDISALNKLQLKK
jgi:hypothetical protein